MPRSEEQLERMRSESRERIRRAALRLFAHHGYAATTVRMIAREAGVSQGLLYNYYAGKEALLREIFARSLADVDASLQRAASGATPSDRLERFVRAVFEIVGERLEFWRITYQLRIQPGVLEGVGEGMMASAEAIRRQLETLLGAAGTASPDVEARLLFAAIDGAAQHYALDPAGYPVAEVCRALTQRFAPGGSDVATGLRDECTTLTKAVARFR